VALKWAVLLRVKVEGKNIETYGKERCVMDQKINEVNEKNKNN
jgi:hypothetical protein